ncbi:hypothetical protein CALVIDRAFT_40672 [Calocera viscosa TUFC12733]|uniref:Uncharacterized protein n=1 Tax=Calocera viscosa (strain TUFC12733) TaxID=1330018 RepID=A0A167P295_CALVF|nr:hypothetical protein CALVIDRAFT_40672 [Calocera viscosa TUFC12733]
MMLRRKRNSGGFLAGMEGGGRTGVNVTLGGAPRGGDTRQTQASCEARHPPCSLGTVRHAHTRCTGTSTSLTTVSASHPAHSHKTHKTKGGVSPCAAAPMSANRGLTLLPRQ